MRKTRKLLRDALPVLLRGSLLAILCTSVLPAGATLYRWVDDQGQVHYSDSPPETKDAEEVDLGPTNTFQQPRATPRPDPASEAATATATPTETVAADAPIEGYREFSIVSPTQDSTLVNIGGELRVNLRIEPQLSDQHHFVVLLDGSPVTPPSRSRSLLLREVYRGQHSVQVVVRRAGGDEVARTPAVSFFVRQNSVAN